MKKFEWNFDKGSNGDPSRLSHRHLWSHRIEKCKTDRCLVVFQE